MEVVHFELFRGLLISLALVQEKMVVLGVILGVVIERSVSSKE